MKKKYQVFISSTYSDLIAERTTATQCLLDNDCIPVGMEQFPASEMSQMDYIRRMLDDCDYYILILGGRYGSLDKDGIGYTEKEYDYAIARGIPVLGFVFDKPENLPARNCETNDEMREKFRLFREKVCSNRLVKFHNDLGSLKANIATSINKCIRDFPAVGWVRGSNEKENLSLEQIIADYVQEHTATKEEINAIFDEKVKLIPRMNVTTIQNSAGGDTVYIDEIVEAYTSTTFSGEFAFDYSDNNGEYTIGVGDYTFRTKWSKSSDVSIYAYSDAKGIDAIARVKSVGNLYEEIKGPFDFSSRCRCVQIGDAILWKNKSGNYAITKIVSIQDDTRGGSKDQLVCEYIIYTSDCCDLNMDRIVFQNKSFVDEQGIIEQLSQL